MVSALYAVLGALLLIKFHLMLCASERCTASLTVTAGFPSYKALSAFTAMRSNTSPQP